MLSLTNKFVIIIMKLNFIKNLSDEMIRDNHNLKNELISLNQKIKTYQEQMVNFINQICPQRQLLTTPEEVLKQFIRQIKELFISNNTKQTKLQRLQNQLQQLRQQREIIKQEVLNKQNSNIQYCKKWVFQKETLSFKIERLQDQFHILQVTHDSLEFVIQNFKKEKITFEEKKRTDIDAIRMNFNQQLIIHREKSELEYLKLQRRYMQEMEQKDKTIMQMNSSLQKLKDNLQLDEKGGKILAKMFQSLQQYTDLSKKLQYLQNEYNSLREQKVRLYNQNINLECKMSEFKAIEFNLMNINNRLTMEKVQMENKLVEKISQMNKSQKDKQAMEAYYDQKWNTEYKKVKNKLQKVFQQKIRIVEEEFQRKINEMNLVMSQAIQKRRAAEERNSILQGIFQQDKKQKETLNYKILQEKNKCNQLRKASIECQKMFQEELLSVKFVHKQEKQIKIKQNLTLSAQIVFQRQRLLQQHLQHCQKVSELQKVAESNLERQLKQFNDQKQKQKVKHVNQINNLKKQIVNKEDMVHQVKLSMQGHFSAQLKLKQKAFMIKIKENQEENKRKCDKWMDKYKQMESVMALLRNKNQEDHLAHQKQISVLQRQHETLSQRMDQLMGQLTQLRRIKDAYHTELGKLQLHIVQKENDISMRDQKISALKINLDQSKRQIQTLIANRKHWQNQLIVLEQKFKQELQSLLKYNQQQISIYKLKISEMEDLNKRRMINQKDYQKIQSLKTEKKEIKDEMHVKEAENIILTQVKSYYETKLKDAEFIIGKSQFRNTHSIIARKLKKRRMNTNVSEVNPRIFEPAQIEQKKRYFPATTRRNYNFSLSKSKFQKSQERFRLPSSIS